MNTKVMTAQTAPRVTAQHKRALVAACIGNFIEYFDFVIYGYFASVIARLFFPAENQAASLLLIFAVFAISYAPRPLGGIIFGHLGDRYGRKTPLAMAIMLIAASTTLIGLMPTYDSIGMAAPIILTLARLVQGISVGGEYGGGVASLLTALLSPEALHAWGWRLPFLAGLPLGFVGLYLRLKLEETPHFAKVKNTAEVVKAPLLAGLRQEWRAVVIGMGLIAAPSACIYIYYIYSPTYLSVVRGFSLADAQRANLYSLIFYCCLLPCFAWLSDKVGRRPLMIFSTLAIALVTYPAFHLLNPASFSQTVMGLCLMSLAFAPHSATALCAMAEIMPTRLRYTCLSVSLNIPVTLLGGTAPFIATWLVSRTGDLQSPAWFVTAAALASLAASLAYRETLRTGLRQH